MELLWAPFVEFAFMRRALLGGVALALSAAPLGMLLILRRLSLIGDAIAHGILPGAAPGFRLFGLSLPALALGGLLASLSLAAADKLQVVTSFSIIADITHLIAGDDVELRNLIGADADAHLYQPSAVDAKALLQADLIIVNGLRFIAPQGLSTEDEPATDGMRAVLVENIRDPRLIQQIAAEGGARVGGTLYSDALASAGPASTYLGMFKHNLDTLLAALQMLGGIWKCRGEARLKTRDHRPATVRLSTQGAPMTHKPSITLRDYRAEDFAAVVELFHASVHGLTAAHYEAAGVERQPGSVHE